MVQAEGFHLILLLSFLYGRSAPSSLTENRVSCAAQKHGRIHVQAKLLTLISRDWITWAFSF